MASPTPVHLQQVHSRGFCPHPQGIPLPSLFILTKKKKKERKYQNSKFANHVKMDLLRHCQTQTTVLENNFPTAMKNMQSFKGSCFEKTVRLKDLSQFHAPRLTKAVT